MGLPRPVRLQRSESEKALGLEVVWLKAKGLVEEAAGLCQVARVELPQSQIHDIAGAYRMRFLRHASLRLRTCGVAEHCQEFGPRPVERHAISSKRAGLLENLQALFRSRTSVSRGHCRCRVPKSFGQRQR